MKPPDLRRFAPHAAAVALLALMIGVSPDFGYTWDERFQQAYGQKIWEYLNGRLPRSAFDTDFGNEYLYGGLVEVLCVAAQHLVDIDTYVVRHAVISVFGWVGIVFSGLLAARLWGPRAGWLASALLALSPRYFGDSMNNPKDIPFAALSMVVLYYTLTISARPPHLTWRHAAKLGAAIALAINVRPLALALLGYAALVIGVVTAWTALRSSDPQRWRHVWTTFARLAAIATVAIPAGTILWPWAQAAPFTRPIQAFLISSSARWAAGFHVLYAGQDHGAGSMPWHYVPLWLAISLPPVILVGLAIVVLFFRGIGSRAASLGLAAFAVAPVAAAIARNATIYDGIRHLEFIVPPLVALSAAGWDSALRNGPPLRLMVAGALALGMLEPLVFQIRNHPNQIVYFSPALGGPQAAFGRFDMDYWGNSMLQAVDWAAALAEEAQMPLIVSSGNLWDAIDANAPRYSSLVAARRHDRDYHLDIRLLRGPREAVIAFAKRPDVLYAVRTADGTPLSVVLPGPRYHQVQERLEHRRP